MASTLNASSSGAGGLVSTADASGILQLQTAGTTAVTVDASQNVGIGVTPSAWRSAFNVTYGERALEVTYSALVTQAGPSTILANNVYFNSSNQWIYKNAVANTNAGLYTIGSNGVHSWSVAPTGASGAVATFTQAMTLDGSGNLGVGTTTVNAKLDVLAANVALGSNGIVKVGADSSGADIGGQITFYNTNARRAAIAGRQESTDAIAGYLQFGTRGTSGDITERARIDSSGNFGIGTSSPSARLHISGTTDATQRIIVNGTGNVSSLKLQYNGTEVAQFQNYQNSEVSIGSTASAPLLLVTNNTERARIDSSGNLLVGTTSVASGGGVICAVQSGNFVATDIRATNASFTSSVINLEASRNTTNTSYYFFSGTITGIQTKIRIADSGNITNVNGSYGTISDAKLKTDIVDAGSQWADIKAVKFRKFKMIDDPDQRVQLGVIAQEIEQVSAGLIEEHTDRDSDDNDLGTTTKSVKTSVLLMKAAVALQEAMQRIEQLEARLDAANL